MMDCATCEGSERCVLHDQIEAGQLAEFVSHGQTRRLKKKKYLFHQNENPAGLWVLRQGRVKIIRSNEMGKSLITRVVFSGELVGYRALLAEEPYAASAQAMDDCQCTFIDGVYFKSFLRMHEHLSFYLLMKLARLLGEAENNTERIAHQDARSRVTHNLVQLACTNKRYRIPGSNRRTIQILRRDLAELTGLTVETTVRVIKSMEQDGLIEISGKNIRLRKSMSHHYIQRV